MIALVCMMLISTASLSASSSTADCPKSEARAHSLIQRNHVIGVAADDEIQDESGLVDGLLQKEGVEACAQIF